MTEGIGEREARYALDLVTRICREVGPGLPGTPQERQRADILRRALEAHLGAANTSTEEFEVAPAAFLGSLPIGAALTLAATILLGTAAGFPGVPSGATTAAAVACSTVAVLLVALEFVLGFEVVDRWFPTARSVNVVGSLGGPGTASRLLIVSAHHDSAPENTWFRFLGYGGFAASATMFIAHPTVLVLGLLQSVGLALGDADLVRLATPGWLLLGFPIVPGVVAGLFFTRGWRGGGTVPGAVDNLAACAICVALCRFLVEHPEHVPPDTEVRFITFGSEEAGVRGSRRYVARHLDELRRRDARVLNLEMVGDPLVTILSSDVNGSVRNSPELVSSVVAAAESAGVPYRVKAAGMGVATDAGPFSRAGLRALTLLPFDTPRQLVAIYHQEWDGPEVLTLPPLVHVLAVALAWVRSGGEAGRRRAPGPVEQPTATIS